MIQFIIELPEITSLKDKRQIVKSLKDKLIQKYKLSVAEVDLHDSLRYAHIGAALVSNSKSYGESVLHKALNFTIENVSGRLADTSIFSEHY